MSTRPETDDHAIEQSIEATIAAHGRLDPGEIIVHYDLVVVTRMIDDDAEHIRRHHWTRTGSDPHVSYGALTAQAKRIMRKIM